MPKTDQQVLMQYAVHGDEPIEHALAHIPGLAKRSMTEQVQEIAHDIVAISRRRAGTPLQRLAARSLSQYGTTSGATITAGGGGVAGNGTYGDIFFGAEFGGGRSRHTRQFQRYRSKGYFFWPTLWAARTMAPLEGTLDEIEKYWAGGK